MIEWNRNFVQKDRGSKSARQVILEMIKQHRKHQSIKSVSKLCKALIRIQNQLKIRIRINLYVDQIAF